ncbi:bacterial transcriptional activator domain-containing protein [Streptacidiphilus monticola]
MTGLLPVLHDVRCDWHTFQRLAKRGLAADAHGVTDLEEALALVRGRPFEGTLASWAAPVQQEMISRIIDVAHTVAHHRTRGGFYDHARKAVTLGLAIEPAAELLIRDWIVLEMNAGNRAALPRSAPTSPPHYATSTPTWNPQPSNSSPTHRPKPPGTPPRPSHTKLRSTARRTADHDTCQNTPAAAQLSELPRVSWSPVVWVQADCGVASWR